MQVKLERISPKFRGKETKKSNHHLSVIRLANHFQPLKTQVYFLLAKWLIQVALPHKFSASSIRVGEKDHNIHWKFKKSCTDDSSDKPWRWGRSISPLKKKQAHNACFRAVLKQVANPWLQVGPSLKATCNSTAIKQNNAAILFPIPTWTSRCSIFSSLSCNKKLGAKAGFEVFFPPDSG